MERCSFTTHLVKKYVASNKQANKRLRLPYIYILY